MQGKIINKIFFFHFLSFAAGDFSFTFVVFLLLLLFPFLKLFVEVVEFLLDRFAL